MTKPYSNLFSLLPSLFPGSLLSSWSLSPLVYLFSLSTPSSLQVETFLLMYRAHSQRILDSAIRGHFHEIQDFLLHFWKGMPQHILPILGCQVTVDLAVICDFVLYNVRPLVPFVFTCRNFSNLVCVCVHVVIMAAMVWIICSSSQCEIFYQYWTLPLTLGCLPINCLTPLKMVAAGSARRCCARHSHPIGRVLSRSTWMVSI